MDGGAPVQLAIDLQSKTVGGRVDGLAPGKHTLTITYRMNDFIVAIWSSEVEVKAGETSRVAIDSSILQYPDDDQDGLSNLQELLDGSDPKDPRSPMRLLSIHVTASDTNLGVGATVQLKVSGSFNAGADQDLTSFMNWQSSGDAIATVSSAGLVTALSPGTVVITAVHTATRLSGAIELTVIPAGSLPLTVTFGIKQLQFHWPKIGDDTFYRLFENPDGVSGFSQVGADIQAGTTTVTRDITVHRHNCVKAR